VKGHRAANCRNAWCCFTCGKLGHFTNTCSRSSRQAPPPSGVSSSSFSNPSSFILVSYVTPPLNSISKPKILIVPVSYIFSSVSFNLMGSYPRRVMCFLENDISARLELEVANGVALSSNTHLHEGDLLSALRIYFSTKGHQWTVHFLRGSRFLVMAPAAWCVQALERGFVLLGDLKVGVHPYAPDLDVR
jgi:hypothetical protein